MTVGSLLCEEHGYAQPSLFESIALDGVACEGCQLGSESVGECLACPRVSTIGAPVHAHMLGINLLLELLRNGHLASCPLLLAPCPYIITVPSEQAQSLSHLLLESHPTEQVLYTLFHRQGFVLIW